MLERHTLGEAGLVYIRERLTSGASLSTLLAHLPLETGYVCAYLPPAMSEEEAHQFDHAGISLLATGLPDERHGPWTVVRNVVDPFMKALLVRALHVKETAVAVWEEAMAHASDPWVRAHPEEPFFFVDEEVYYLVDHTNATEQAVTGGLSRMDAWQGAPAILATQPEGNPLRPHTTATREQLQALAEHVQLLFFTAYDREGFVLWAPTDALFPTSLP